MCLKPSTVVSYCLFLCHMNSVEPNWFLLFACRGSLFSCVVNSAILAQSATVTECLDFLCVFRCLHTLSFSPHSSVLVLLSVCLASSPPPSSLLLHIRTTSQWDHIQCGLIQISEKQCVSSLVSRRAHWTTATSALRPLGLKSVTFDPWETLMHNDSGEQCGPSSVCPKRATVDCRSYNLSWIHHPPGRRPLPSETTGLLEEPGSARVTHWCWDRGYGLCVWVGVCVYSWIRWWNSQTISFIFVTFPFINPCFSLGLCHFRFSPASLS